jgi:hypothetical protein
MNSLSRRNSPSNASIPGLRGLDRVLQLIG